MVGNYWKWMPLYLEHTKYQEQKKRGSRNVSFYIKFSVLEVGHAISKKANWDMQQSKVFVDVSLSNYKKLWKTLIWHLCKKLNSFKFLKIKFLISRNSITCVSNSCRGYDLMLLFLHNSIFGNQKWIIGFVCLPKDDKYLQHTWWQKLSNKIKIKWLSIQINSA